MIKTSQVHLFDLVTSISNAMDLISPVVAGHHLRTAYIAVRLAEEMGLPMERQKLLLLAGALHDSGAFSLKERHATLRFDMEDNNDHAEMSYILLRNFSPLSQAASIVRWHHVHWNEVSGSRRGGDEVPLETHILHLADRVDVIIDRGQEILSQADGIREQIVSRSGEFFMPALVDSFEALAAQEYFWLDAASPRIHQILGRNYRSGWGKIALDVDELVGLASLFRQMIDFRSRFTADHSSGVAASAETLAGLAGFSEGERLMMRVAGYLHDLGKLVIPAEILEKPGSLTAAERNLIRSHTYYTYRILESIGGLEVVNTWASFHHEHLDGSGYPFHVGDRDMSLGSRIMAVADKFTALTENRPYRSRMEEEAALGVLEKMAEASKVDRGIVSLLKNHFDKVNSARRAAQLTSAQEYIDVARARGKRLHSLI